MTKLQKLLAASSLVAASLAMASPANALYTVTSGTRYIAGGTVTSAAMTLTATGNTIVINTTDVAGVTSGEFSQAFNDGSNIVITLSSGKFAATPTIALNGGPAPTVTGGAGVATLGISFAGGSTGVVSSVTISNITLNNLVGTATTDTITAALSGTAFAPGNPYLTQNLVRYSAPIGFSPKANNVTVNGTDATAFRDSKGSLGLLAATITATRAYDGVTAVTLGAPSTKAQLSALTAGSFSNVTFTETSGAATPCLGASTAVSSGLIAATDIVNPAAGTAGFGGCNVGITLTPSGVTAIAPATVTLDVSVPLVNAPTGVTTPFATTLTSVGAIGNTAGTTATIPLSYNFGADAAYGYYVSVTAPNQAGTDPTNVSFRSGPFTTTSTFAGQIAPGTTKLFSVEVIRAGLIAGGAPSSLFNGSSARAPLSVTVPGGAIVTALIQNKGQNIVTEVGKNLNTAPVVLPANSGTATSAQTLQAGANQ